MKDIILALILLIILGGSVFYIIKAKKHGKKCIGCPYAKECSGGCHNKKTS